MAADVRQGERVTGSPSAVLVIGVVEAVMSGDFTLARWRAREAVLARVSALWDDGHDVVMSSQLWAVSWGQSETGDGNEDRGTRHAGDFVRRGLGDSPRRSQRVDGSVRAAIVTDSVTTLASESNFS